MNDESNLAPQWADTDPPRDPELARLLRGAIPGPVGSPDWNAMRERIHERAELPLARRRRRAPQWVQALALFGAAACLAVVVRLAPNPEHPPVVEPLLSTSAEQEIQRLISGQEAREALLQAVLEGPQAEG